MDYMTRVAVLSLLTACVVGHLHSHEHSSRHARQVGGGAPAGGRALIEVDDDVKDLARRAVRTKYNAESNDQRHYIVCHVLKAESQVVSGKKTHLQIIMAESTCDKPVTDETDCMHKSNGKAKLCYFTVWEQAWKDFEQIDLVGCDDIEYDENDDNDDVTDDVDDDVMWLL